MHRSRLLERVSLAEHVAQGQTQSTTTPRARRRETGSAEFLRSVIDHLSRLLNTRQGFVPLDAGFGVCDFTNLGAGTDAGELADVERQLQSMIERYEPRLRRPVVRVCRQRSDALNMRFTIDATIGPGPAEYSLHLATRIDPQGQVRIHATDE